MNIDILKKKLIIIARQKISKNDVSHDFYHAMRVLNLAERISKKEEADLEIITPAALFHDAIVYNKHHSSSKNEVNESAKYAVEVLSKIKEYPKEKIMQVEQSIQQCSFRKGINPKTIEAKILQDADRLEATGAISIMRTFASTGQWGRPFCDPKDPFCKNRETNTKSYALDLFFERLLKVENLMHTKMAKKLARRRTQFLRDFLEEFRLELEESSSKNY